MVPLRRAIGRKPLWVHRDVGSVGPPGDEMATPSGTGFISTTSIRREESFVTHTLAPLSARLEGWPDEVASTTKTCMHVRCGRRQSWYSVDSASPKAGEGFVDGANKPTWRNGKLMRSSGPIVVRGSSSEPGGAGYGVVVVVEVQLHQSSRH
jgi:hypothetical protein